ncbi:MAG: bifunctional folylpolyglutamate synthase/dihydrofolate synthase [Snowella sp.]|jgi:dihydrofolate synthase/folylpolyglutamate synthase|nr:MAG: bifunctional folylpolyglutamate synthase/dihydrofolate synthase [Snowella sp.]
MTIESYLKPYQRFGVHLGLDRILSLLEKLGNPQQKVPIIHVAGTNGKGSVCAYLSSILTAAGYRVGRYTSPHLVNWTERICINEVSITEEKLIDLLEIIQQKIPDHEADIPTQFEVITAAAWLYFAKEKVDIAVIEVGLGGRLDATNVVSNPLVSVITSLSMEHWQILGPTLRDIAQEKAGIIKPYRPAVIGVLPTEVTVLIRTYLESLQCPARWISPAKEVIKENQRWARYQGLEYPLPLFGDVQLINSAIAIAAIQCLRDQGWEISNPAIQEGMGKTRWAGRLQWTTWQGRAILVDGAHNTAAAEALRQYLNSLGKPVHWVMGMLSTKDHPKIFQALLQAGDRLSLVPVPDHSSAEPTVLAGIAKGICPDLETLEIFPDLSIALDSAVTKCACGIALEEERVIVLCGSLYLVGHFLGDCVGVDL